MPEIKDKFIESKENYTPIGKLYSEELSKNHEVVELRELQREFNKDYMDNIILAAMNGKKLHEGSYYVVVLMKRERLMQKVLRNYFLTRKSCPTPSPDQTVYKFDPKTEDLEFLWVIPSRKICDRLYLERYHLNNLKCSLTPYVVDYIEGRLYFKAKELNGETTAPGCKLKK